MVRKHVFIYFRSLCLGDVRSVWMWSEHSKHNGEKRRGENEHFRFYGLFSFPLVILPYRLIRARTQKLTAGLRKLSARKINWTKWRILMKIVPRLLKAECFLGSSLKLYTHCADERMAHKWSENSMFRRRFN